MNRELLKRLDAAERRHAPDDNMPACISIQIVDGQGERLPVLGWRECMVKDAQEVWGEAGESDDDLEARALSAFKASPWRQPGSVPVMVAITEGEAHGQA